MACWDRPDSFEPVTGEGSSPSWTVRDPRPHVAPPSSRRLCGSHRRTRPCAARSFRAGRSTSRRPEVTTGRGRPADRARHRAGVRTVFRVGLPAAARTIPPRPGRAVASRAGRSHPPLEDPRPPTRGDDGGLRPTTAPRAAGLGARARTGGLGVSPRRWRRARPAKRAAGNTGRAAGGRAPGASAIRAARARFAVAGAGATVTGAGRTVRGTTASAAGAGAEASPCTPVTRTGPPGTAGGPGATASVAAPPLAPRTTETVAGAARARDTGSTTTCSRAPARDPAASRPPGRPVPAPRLAAPRPLRLRDAPSPLLSSGITSRSPRVARWRGRQSPRRAPGSRALRVGSP